jgi:hypothetical protein
VRRSAELQENVEIRKKIETYCFCLTVSSQLFRTSIGLATAASPHPASCFSSQCNAATFNQWYLNHVHLTESGNKNLQAYIDASNPSSKTEIERQSIMYGE